jgi:hypothetical protein
MMYVLMQDGIQIAVFTSLKACQIAATAVQYCIYIN